MSSSSCLVKLGWAAELYVNEIDRRVRNFVLRILKLDALRRCIVLPKLGGREAGAE